MKTTSMTRAFAVGFLAGLFSSFGCSSPSVCTPANCNGCCDDAGLCRAGNTAASCGLGGSACISCGASVCNPNGTCFLAADGAVTGPTDDAGLPVTEDGGLVELDAGAPEDAGAADDAGAPEDAGLPDAGELDAGVPDAGVGAGVFLPRDQCDTPMAVGVPGAGNWTDFPIAAFSNGRILLGYLESLPGNHRVIQTRLYEGGTWGPVVTHGGSNWAAPQATTQTLSSAGNAALLVATGFNVWVRRAYSRQLDAWAEFPWLNPPNSTDAFFVRASGPEAFFHAWYSLGPPVYASVSPTGVTTDTSVSTATSRAVKMEAVLTSEGEMALVWFDQSYVLRGRFIAPTGLEVGGEARHDEPTTVAITPTPAIAALPDGDALVFWERRNRDLSVQLMMTTLRDGMMEPSFDPPTVLVQTTTSESFSNPQALVDAQGDVTLTWLDVVSTPRTRAMRRVAGLWGPPVVVSTPPGSGSATSPRAVVDRDGHVTVSTYLASSPPGLEIRRIARGSLTWGAPVRVTPADFAFAPTAGQPALALDENDAPVVLYRLSSASSPIMWTTCR